MVVSWIAKESKRASRLDGSSRPRNGVIQGFSGIPVRDARQKMMQVVQCHNGLQCNDAVAPPLLTERQRLAGTIHLVE